MRQKATYSNILRYKSFETFQEDKNKLLQVLQIGAVELSLPVYWFQVSLIQCITVVVHFERQMRNIVNICSVIKFHITIGA